MKKIAFAEPSDAEVYAECRQVANLVSIGRSVKRNISQESNEISAFADMIKE